MDANPFIRSPSVDAIGIRPITDPAVIIPYPRQPRPGHNWEVSSVTVALNRFSILVTQPPSVPVDTRAYLEVALLFGADELTLGRVLYTGATNSDSPQVTLSYNSSFTVLWSDTLTVKIRLGIISTQAGDIIRLFQDSPPLNTFTMRLSGVVT